MRGCMKPREDVKYRCWVCAGEAWRHAHCEWCGRRRVVLDRLELRHAVRAWAKR